ncbi:MAG: hypothetical protein H0U98_01515 [Alphaproteobacteria bacterium]|nr:hypothetical protein [Alphaproteobacteria bacterium]
MRVPLWFPGAVLIGLSLPLDAQPLASAGVPETSSNLTGYPDPQCTKPQVKLVRPTLWNDQSGSAGNYNARVRKFNKDTDAYSACMHAYIDKANLDVKIIQDKANADLKQITERANASMKVIEDKAARAVIEAKSVAADLNAQIAKVSTGEQRSH